MTFDHRLDWKREKIYKAKTIITVLLRRKKKRSFSSIEVVRLVLAVVVDRIDQFVMQHDTFLNVY